jgi:4'-phosphopantetheinyl transferase
MRSVEPVPIRSAPLDRVSHGDTGVDFWMVDLDSPHWRDPRTSAGLSDDEKQRAEAFRFDQDRWRFTACRMAVRMILGRYLGSQPSDVRFRYGPYGKPRLDRNAPGAPLHFNVSHSEHVGLVVVSRESEVGIDIEHVRARPGIPDIIEHRCAPAELLPLLRAPEAEYLSRFFRYWTRKEALLKAAGLGMNGVLAAIDVSGPTHPIELPDAGGMGTRSWAAHTLYERSDQVAALAVEAGVPAGFATTMAPLRMGVVHG